MDKHLVQGRCHCGAVQFTARLADGLREPRRCNCSLCRMRGAVVVTASRDDLMVTSGEKLLTLYQFNTRQADHYFCSRCGIYLFHRRRSNPSHMSVNVACLENISPFDFDEVPVFEGRVHPQERSVGPYYLIAGTVTYKNAVEPAT